MSQTIPKHGSFCWNELATKDKGVAEKFYTQLLGWETYLSNNDPHEYVHFRNDGSDIGGMMQITKEWGDVPSHWMTYIAVDDVDATVAKVTKLGGQVRVPATDIPKVGRFSVIVDPTGATFSIIKLLEREQA